MASALVSGGSGAIGKYLVAELLASDKIAAVTVIGRREISFPPDNQPSPAQLEKLQYKHLSEITEIESMNPSQLPSSVYQLGFCCLGTTRKDAGSAEAFRKVDYDCVSYFGNLAKQAQVENFQLVSSTGANKKAFFLYPKTKGEAEEYIRSLSFKHLTIVRPPLLDRGSDARLVEKVAAYVMPSVKVAEVARAMMLQAEKVSSGNEKGETILGLKEIRQLSGQK